MYKRPPNKTRKKIIKTLALTRRALLEIAKSINECGYDISPLWFHSTKRLQTFEDRFYVKQDEIRRAIHQLKHAKFVKIRQEGKRVFCALTEKGKTAALKEAVRTSELLPKGYLCMLSFDVPEQERRVRSRIRRLLKDWGFKMAHQSLWTSDKDIYGPFADFMKDIGMFRWFHIYEARILK